MSHRDAFKLNAWAGVAVLAAIVSRLLLRGSDQTGTLALLVALLPLVPGLLYVRALWRWITGLDELQRRLQLQAVSFATLAMLLIGVTVDLLQQAGFVRSLHFGWEGYFAFTFVLYALGLTRANRGYR